MKTTRKNSNDIRIESEGEERWMEDTNELLRQIKPCGEGKNYIFVSYSSADRDVVYRDVLEFQRQGYNVWLDEKNLDKTKASWKQDALKAIQNWRCRLLVFYVSKNSLISRPCYDELMTTRDEVTRKLHGFKDLKFIAVEVERFHDILQYKEQTAQALYNSEIDQDKCLDKINTLCDFVDHFFNGNNERVRIHARGSVGDDGRYYASILGTFPEEAKTPEDSGQASGGERSWKEVSPVAGEKKGQDLDTCGAMVQEGEAVQGGKRKEGKGDIHYWIYGKEYTENQSSMMLRVFAQVLKRHQDKVDQLPNQPFMNCASRTNYKEQANRTEKMPSYFRICEFFEFENGTSVCIGTAYGIADKMKKIAALLRYCQEDRDIFWSEDVKLPDSRGGTPGRRVADAGMPAGAKGRSVKTSSSYLED